MSRSCIHVLVCSVALAFFSLWLGCASRYRLELTVTDEGVLHRVKVEQTQFASGAVLGDPLSENLVEPGDANCFVVTAGTRGKRQVGSGKYEVLKYDEHLQYRIFIQTPAHLVTGRWPLERQSFVEVMGRYELPKEEKLFTQASGTFAVDSLKNKRAYVTIIGEFKSLSGGSVAVNGKFKIKVK